MALPMPLNVSLNSVDQPTATAGQTHTGAKYFGPPQTAHNTMQVGLIVAGLVLAYLLLRKG